MNRKYILHLIGLVLALISIIKGVPLALKIILAILPLIFFAGQTALSYLKRISKKDFINEYFSALLGTLIILCTGKIGVAALTITLFSAVISIFKDAYNKAQNDIDELCRILPKKAKLVTPQGLKNIPCTDVRAGDTLIVKEGEVIPCDGFVLNGGGSVDYTNVFGPGAPHTMAAGASCYSGGILQSGNMTLKAACDIHQSLAYTMESRTKQAHRMSALHERLINIAKIFQPAFMAFGLLLFLIFIIATGNYGYSMNIFAVLVLSSATLSITKVLPLLYHVTLLNARRKGSLFTTTDSIERLAKVQTLTPCENVTPDDIQKIEETGIVAARNAEKDIDARLYRDKNALLADKSPVYKIALGFFTDKANLCIFDSKAARAAGAIRAARNARSTFFENIACIIIGKLAIISLLFLLKLNPAIAVLIEFASWMVCLVNSTKKN